MEYSQRSVRLPKNPEEKEAWKRVIIILEHCPLSSVSTDKGFELLSEKHRNIHARRNQDPADWRPDVIHQCLLHLLDSPLNRAGMLQVFLCCRGDRETDSTAGVTGQKVIQVDPRLRVPRHYKMFEKMMVMCLYRMKVRSTTGYLALLKIVKHPVTEHIPANTRMIRVEKDGEAVDIFDFCKASCGKRKKGAVLAGDNKVEVIPESAREDPDLNGKRDREEEEGNGGEDADESSSTDEELDPYALYKRSQRKAAKAKAAAVAAPAGTSAFPTKEEPASSSSDEDDEGAAGDSSVFEGNEAYEALNKVREGESFAPFAFVIGGIAKGDVTATYVDKAESIRLGNRGMSAAAVCSKILFAFEEAWLSKGMDAAGALFDGDDIRDSAVEEAE